MSGIFRFKQFHVNQTGCAMKINTDGVLLGALMEVDQYKSILDIGTGTGVIALMLAQRFPDTYIDAVEIDEIAAKTAGLNFANSPYANRLKVHADSFEHFFAVNRDKQYDLIVSNPPFYINSLESPGAKKAMAKHTDTSFFEKLISAIPGHLTDNGLFVMILPIATAKLVKNIAIDEGLYPQQIINVKSYTVSEAHREILSFGRHQATTIQKEFVIYDGLKQYAEEYRKALGDFFTIFP